VIVVPRPALHDDVAALAAYLDEPEPFQDLADFVARESFESSPWPA